MFRHVPNALTGGRLVLAAVFFVMLAWYQYEGRGDPWFLNTAFFELGPQFGVSGEYSVDHNLNIGAQMRFGPQFYSVSGSGTDLAFTTEVVIGYRL